MSITEVAEHAGVSISTVSRYLRGALNVNPDTAERINEAARQFRYKPRDRRDDLRALALIIPELQNPFYSALAQSVDLAALTSGYQLDIKLSQADAGHERDLVDNLAKERRYSGLLYAGLNSTNKALARVRPSGIRMVLLDERMDDPSLGDISSVTVDNYSGAYQAVRYLISLGHRRIAYLSGPVGLSTSRERLNGYTDALKTANIPIDDSIVFSGPYTEEFGSSIFPYLIENKETPTAIFCSSDVSAVGLLGAAEQYGFRIPDDLSIIGCDGIHIGQWLQPRLTTLEQPIDTMAHTAIDLLKSDGEARHVQLPLNLVIRNSTQRLIR